MNCSGPAELGLSVSFDEPASGAEETFLQRKSVGDQFQVVGVFCEETLQRAAGQRDIVVELRDSCSIRDVVGTSRGTDLGVEAMLQCVVVAGLSAAVTTVLPKHSMTPSFKFQVSKMQ